MHINFIKGSVPMTRLSGARVEYPVSLVADGDGELSEVLRRAGLPGMRTFGIHGKVTVGRDGGIRQSPVLTVSGTSGEGHRVTAQVKWSKPWKGIARDVKAYMENHRSVPGGSGKFTLAR